MGFAQQFAVVGLAALVLGASGCTPSTSPRRASAAHGKHACSAACAPAQRLRANPKNTVALAQLEKALPEIPDDTERERLTAAVAIGYKLNGQNTKYEQLRRALQQDVGESGYLRNLKTSSQTPCDKCGGDGKLENCDCGICGGCGRCRVSNCVKGIRIPYKYFSSNDNMEQGINNISPAILAKYSKDKCLNCHGTGKCQNCQGTGKVDKTCPACGGKGAFTKTQDRTAEALADLLRDYLRDCPGG